MQSLGLMRAIKNHHPAAHITLLTTKAFKNLAQKCGYFDDIIIDTRPKIFDIRDIISLKNKLLNANFTHIYDLQNNNRTSFYKKIFPKEIKWIGRIKGVFSKKKPKQDKHAFERHKKTLEKAGIKNIEIDRLEWMREDISLLDLKKPYIIIVAGCAPQHQQKRWCAEKYGKLACELSNLGYQIVLLGTASEENINKTINEICPQALNLTGKTSLFQIAGIACGAAGAVGNDTGPMHIIAPTGCPTLALFSSSSNPICHAPLGDNVLILQENNLELLEISKVLEAAKSIVQPFEHIFGA